MGSKRDVLERLRNLDHTTEPGTCGVIVSDPISGTAGSRTEFHTTIV